MRNFFYQANLPHWQPLEGTFFITYRLYGSIPKPVMEELKFAYEVAKEKVEEEHALEVLKVADQMTSEMKAKLVGVLEKKRYDEHKRSFKKFDDFLDSRLLNEPHWLKQPGIAEFEAANIQHYAERYFQLHAFCIMANHVHLLLKMNPGAPVLWKVLQDMKKYSGRQINRLLGRQGKF